MWPPCTAHEIGYGKGQLEYILLLQAHQNSVETLMNTAYLLACTLYSAKRLYRYTYSTYQAAVVSVDDVVVAVHHALPLLDEIATTSSKFVRLRPCRQRAAPVVRPYNETRSDGARLAMELLVQARPVVALTAAGRNEGRRARRRPCCHGDPWDETAALLGRGSSCSSLSMSTYSLTCAFGVEDTKALNVVFK